MSEDQLLRNRGFEPCPSVDKLRCERWFGVVVSFGLISLCFVSAAVRVWIPSIFFAYETSYTYALRVCFLIGGVLGLATGVLCLSSFVRACTAHPGRVWYRVVDRMQVIPDPEPPAELPVRNASVVDMDSPHPPQPVTVRAATFTTASHFDSERLRHQAGGYYGTQALRHCTQCDRLKPPTVHHCRRCGTCVDRMDHHCPWIGQCVGRGNHKYFMLFLFYTAVAGFVITATSLPNFIRFCAAAFQNPGDTNSSPPTPVAPPPTPSSAPGAPPAPTVTSSPGGDRFNDVDFLMVVVFFIATLFALMLLCFFGTVWDSAVDGSTQLDHTRPYDPMRSVEDNALQFERARSSKEYLKRWSMGRGTAWLWFVPTTPRFDEDSISRL